MVGLEIPVDRQKVRASGWQGRHCNGTEAPVAGSFLAFCTLRISGCSQADIFYVRRKPETGGQSSDGASQRTKLAHHRATPPGRPHEVGGHAASVGDAYSDLRVVVRTVDTLPLKYVSMYLE